MRDISRVHVACSDCEYTHSISAPTDDGQPLEEAVEEARRHSDTQRHNTTVTPPLGAPRSYTPRTFTRHAVARGIR